MKINIVYPGPGHPKLSSILPRLAELLAAETGWSLSQKPDDDADLNYFFPYLLLREHEYYHQTMTAAWFTHREETIPEKEVAWDEAAAIVDLRLTATQLYSDALQEFGPTSITTPPIDPMFRPLETAAKASKPVIGLSGFVYVNSSRKGEDLVKALMESDFISDYLLRAVGRNWPCQCEMVPFQELPQFYNSIDVYLCTSLIEGPGYGPLEALACGTPVVVPHGVGIFDELPPIPGIVHYAKGDFADMLRAIKAAMGQEADPCQLAGVVSRHTTEQWILDHEEPISKILCPVSRLDEALPAWGEDNSGVFMVAFGDEARSCAKKAIGSWRKFMPSVKIALVSDQSLGLEDFFIQHEDVDLGARSVKTDIWNLAPSQWQYIIYVDADTELIADISFLFDILVDGWELAIAYNPEQFSLGRHMIRSDNMDECQATFELIGTDEFLQMNGGVFSFRKSERTEALFRAWHHEWDRWGKRDQAAFDRALYSHPLRVFTLGTEWNTITRYFGADQSAGILHYPTLARRHTGIIHARLDSPEAWKEAGLK
jgi:hypothetical protein